MASDKLGGRSMRPLGLVVAVLAVIGVVAAGFALTRDRPVGVEGTWTVRAVPFAPREWPALGAADGNLFVWGGDSKAGGPILADGALVQLDSGGVIAIPVAPIGGRRFSSVVWNGDEFLVFGGHTDSRSHVDGAAFDPVSEQWRIIAEAPFDPGPYPSAVWTGSEMIVWLATTDTATTSETDVPTPGPGQVAAYDPTSNTWEALDPPPVMVSDAALFYYNGLVHLVGGPPVRPLGVVGTGSPLVAATLDVARRTWTGPVFGDTRYEIAAAFDTDAALGAIAEGDLVTMGDNSLNVTTTTRADCHRPPVAASSPNHAFLWACTAYLINNDGELTEIPDAIAPGGTDPTSLTRLSTPSGFTADERGRLIVLATHPGADPDQQRGIIAIYEP